MPTCTILTAKGRAFGHSVRSTGSLKMPSTIWNQFTTGRRCSGWAPRRAWISGAAARTGVRPPVPRIAIESRRSGPPDGQGPIDNRKPDPAPAAPPGYTITDRREKTVDRPRTLSSYAADRRAAKGGGREVGCARLVGAAGRTADPKDDGRPQAQGGR